MKNASTLSWIWGQVYSIAQIDQLLMKGIREISQNSAWPNLSPDLWCHLQGSYSARDLGSSWVAVL